MGAPISWWQMSAAENLPGSGGGRGPGVQAPSSVLLVTPLWGRDGGVAAHVKESAAALARHGLEVHVIAARVDAGERSDGVTLHHRPELLDAHASLQTRLGELLADAPDVAHIHQVDDHAIVDALRMRAPVVISAHGFPGCTSGVHYFSPGQECTRAHGPGCVPNLLLRGCAHTRYLRTLPAKYAGVTRGLAMLRDADLVVSYSSAVDRHLAANDLPSRAVVPYFPTTAPREASGHETRRRVVFAGRLVAAKGVDVLIRALAQVDAELVVCGEGRREPKLRALAQRLGIAERVHFRGWMDAERLAAEIAQASVLAVPSLWPEPFGIVGIEAFAAGRPAVGSATGGIVDWLKDGVCGLAVAPGDAGALARALARLLDDPALAQAMGQAGKELVAERFSAECHVAAILDGYRRALAGWREGPERVRARQAA
jgi:glycosyltransferase involved in cell wall biosynthesis